MPYPEPRSPSQHGTPASTAPAPADCRSSISLDPRPGERVQDLGAGTGEPTHAIAARGADVLAVDASQAMVNVARAAYAALTVEVTDGQLC
jgi:2-polyprenyl-3-methyl-5-hydroxy-6-metoxy-1,4-benzoquinol methylase